ncbi:nima interactive protein [Phlyctema vagabunda]|uniref:Nima interactive protein n=1 Tax=Phlyctema vagabunda TaxID=108571 RepID=A0ABR4PGQ9_9HELO
MESDNLRTASLYINNQLLSRGLLRNGQTIEFARPDRDEAGVEGTMGRIMGVVNDLILRRDRDAQQRENLAQTIRALGADALRHATELERLSGKNTEAQRRLGVAEATERALKQQIRSAEQAARVLKEEMGRMKLLVGQTRAQCANEVRKRERVIEGMKKHVGEGGRTRGSGKAPGVTTINVVAGIGAEAGNSGAMDTEDTSYDLRTETNEFLTELARGLSEDNENLGGLVRRTVETLRTLSGYEKDNTQEGGLVIETETAYERLATEMEFVVEHVRNLLTNPSFVPLEEVVVREEEIIRLREGWEKMEGRWREAVEMMDGWRKRMTRSGQTVNLEELKMGIRLSPLKPEEQADKERVFDLSTLEEEGEGDTQADIDAMDDSEVPNSGEGDVEGEPEYDFEDSQSESSLFEDEPMEEEEEEVMEEEEDEDEDDTAEQQEEAEEEDFSMNTASSISLGPAPQISPLRETSPNKNPNPIQAHIQNHNQHHNAFTTIIEENTLELLDLVPNSSSTTTSGSRDAKSRSTPTPSRRSPSKQKEKENLTTTSSNNSRSTPTPSARGRQAKAAFPKLQAVTPRSTSRLPRPREQAAQQSPLTMASIVAKLAATEREADAARVRAKIKAARSKAKAQAQAQAPPVQVQAAPAPSPPGSAAPSPRPRPRSRPQSPVKTRHPAASSPLKNEVALPSHVHASGKKRKAVMGAGGNGRANRRRSTLSPWELESLILGNLGGGGEVPSPVK